MNKIPKSEIPENLLKWCDDTEDFWIMKYIRSMGYTREEMVRLAEKNRKIKYALRMALDSLIDKVIHRVAAGYFNTEFADFVLKQYAENFKLIEKKKPILIKLGGENFDQ
jgi:hypothetical protein